MNEKILKILMFVYGAAVLVWTVINEMIGNTIFDHSTGDWVLDIATPVFLFIIVPIVSIILAFATDTELKEANEE